MAFDLVAKLKLQDEFSDKLKSVFAQLDKLKGQVKQAATGTSDMGAKFSTAGTVASTALGKVGNTAKAMSTDFDKYSALSKNSIQSIGSGAEEMKNVLNTNSAKGSSSLDSLGKAADRLPVKFSEFSNVAGRTLADASNAAEKLGKSISASGQQSEKSLGALSNSATMIEGAFKNSGNVASRSLEAVSKGADTLGTSTDKAARLSQSSLKVLSDRANEAANKMQEVGEKSQSGFTKSSKAIEGTKKVMKSMTTDSTASLKLMTSGVEKMRSAYSTAGSKASKAMDALKNKLNTVKTSVSKVGEGGKKALGMIDRSLFGLPSKFSKMASTAAGSLRNGIRGPAISAKNAILGIASAVGAVAVASKVFNMLKGAMGSAVARYDTLNNFPRVMQSMGFSADESKAAIDRLSKGIDGLPTRLDEIASTAQRIATSSGDLGKATETAIALNNALLASGSDAEKASRGTEQYLKSLAKGSMDMDSWTTLQETMGLGLNELAKAFGITGDNLQNQLYKKLKDGDITMDAFNEKLIEISESTGGLAELARDATGGLATAWSNMNNAIARGLTDTIEATDKALGGTGKISDIIIKMKEQISVSFKSINKYVLSFVKTLKKVYDATKPIHPVLKDIAKAALIFGGVLGAMATAAGAIAGIGALFAVIGSGVGIAIVAVAGLVTGFVLAYQKIEPFRNAVQDLLGTFKEVFNVLKSGSGGGDLMKKMGFSEGQIQVARNFVDNVTETFGKMKEGFRQLGDFFVTKGQELAPTLDILAEAFSIGKEVLVSVFTTLWAVLQPIFGALKNALMIVADIAVMAWTQIIAPAVQFAMKIFQTAWAIIGPILKLLGSAIGAAFEILKLAWDNVMKPVAKFLMGRFKTAFENLTPILDSVKGGFDLIGGAIEKVAGWFDSFKSALSRFKVPNWLSKLGGGGTVKFEGGGDEGGGEGRYNGIKYVPRDNGHYRLHRGERVLTAKENKQYDKGNKSPQVLVTGNVFHVRQESDIDAIANTLFRKVIAAGEGGA